MTQILELADREFKITLIKRLRAVMEKANNMEEWMGNVSKEMEILRVKKKFWKPKMLPQK